MRTFLLFLPLRWLRNELFVGCLLPPFCNRDNDDVEDEKEDDGVPDRLGRRGSECARGSSFTFSFTLNILSELTLLRTSSFWYFAAFFFLFQCQQVWLKFARLRKRLIYRALRRHSTHSMTSKSGAHHWFPIKGCRFSVIQS